MGLTEEFRLHVETKNEKLKCIYWHRKKEHRKTSHKPATLKGIGLSLEVSDDSSTEILQISPWRWCHMYTRLKKKNVKDPIDLKRCSTESIRLPFIGPAYKRRCQTPSFRRFTMPLVYTYSWIDYGSLVHTRTIHALSSLVHGPTDPQYFCLRNSTTLCFDI